MLRVPQSELRDFSRLLLEEAGASPADATEVAAALVWADLRGRPPQGVTRLPMLVERLARGLITSPASFSWSECAAGAHRLDAANAFGAVAGRAGMERAIALSRAHGIALVVVRDSNLYGAASYYCALAAEAGCLALSGSNAVPKVAPPGGLRPALGTNPLAFGCPTASGAPILVDLATSAISGSGARELAELGEPLPPGVALDAAGASTTDPAAVACLLPAAGAKGFGLALMVEILSAALSAGALGREVGSMYSDLGRPAQTAHFFLAIDVARLLPLSEFLDRVESLLRAIHGAGPRGAVRFPGELRARLAERNTRDGVPLAPRTAAALETLAAGLGSTPPWARGDGASDRAHQ